MAIANLHETLLFYTLRRNVLNVDIMKLQSELTLMTAERADYNSILSARKTDCRNRWKAIYDADEETYKADGYHNYAEMADYLEEIDLIEAEIQEELERISTKEEQIKNQITTDDTELKEIDAYTESMKSMLTSNIQSDFNFGLNGG